MVNCYKMNFIETWKNDNEKKNNSSKENLLKFSKKYSKEEQDALTSKINLEVTSSINCLDCANCCKTTVTTFTHEDINKAAKFLGVSKKEFIKKYLINDMEEYTTITTPCPFLLEDNKCKIYEARPHSCSSFPHTHKKNFVVMGSVHKMNYSICPITYFMVKRIEEQVK